MVDISSYISVIENAVRGEDVRDAIIGALDAMNHGTTTAYTLNGHDASYFAKQSDMDKILPLDSIPTEGSQRGVSSGGLYTYLTNLITLIDSINGESI